MTEARVKICGLTRREDVLHAQAAGADYVGAVLVPGSPRAVDPGEARTLFHGLEVPTVAVVVNRSLDDLVRVLEEVEPSVLQLHGDESPDLVQALRTCSPMQVWKAVAVRGPEDLEAAMEVYGSQVDGFVLDTWDPKRRGGTGRPFPWEAVAAAVRQMGLGSLVVAAGGLDGENVQEAVALLGPDVVDVSSGVESAPGVKDPVLVTQFIVRAKKAEGGGEK